MYMDIINCLRNWTYYAHIVHVHINIHVHVTTWIVYVTKYTLYYVQYMYMYMYKFAMNMYMYILWICSQLYLIFILSCDEVSKFDLTTTRQRMVSFDIIMSLWVPRSVTKEHQIPVCFANHLLSNHTFTNCLIWKTSKNCVSDLSRHKCLFIK